jgi:hypothetical protein
MSQGSTLYPFCLGLLPSSFILWQSPKGDRQIQARKMARRANFLFLARSVSEGDYQPTRARNEREAEANKGSRCSVCWGVNEPSWSPSLTLRARNARARPATLLELTTTIFDKMWMMPSWEFQDVVR